jgi:hypothetical protein
VKVLEFKEFFEAVGVIAVAVSLIFVGFELRQNPKVAKTDAYSAYVSDMVEITLQMSTDPALAGIVMRTFEDQDFEELSIEEQGMLLAFYVAQLTARSGLHTAINEGIIAEGFGGPLNRTSFFDNDAFRSVWPRVRREFDDDFIKLFEAQSWNRGAAKIDPT